MFLSPALLNKLRLATHALSDQYQANLRAQAHQEHLLGLVSLVAGLPLCAIKGIKPALSACLLTAYQFHKAHKHELRLKQVQELHQTLDPQYVPKMRLPTMRPY